MTSADVPEANRSNADDGSLEQLCSRARDGDERAFEQLYHATVGQVYGLCLRMTANPAVAEEATQAAFVQAWRNLERFRGDAQVTTWLHRIAVNEVLGSFRREARHAHEPEAAIEMLAAGHAADPDLERAISRLPEQARNVFVLYGVYGYGHRETATMLGIAEGTSKAHYHNARRLLRQALDGGHA